MQGTKVQFRQLDFEDLDKVWRWRNDPQVAEFLSNLQISRILIDVWFKEYDGSPHGRFFAIETHDKNLIGYTGLRDLNWTNRTSMMDIIIGEKAYWSQGYGQDAVGILLKLAFHELELTKVSLAVLPFNARAIRCYEKCGFRRSGFHNEKYLRRGKIWQPIRMEITRPQYDLVGKVTPL